MPVNETYTNRTEDTLTAVNVGLLILTDFSVNVFFKFLTNVKQITNVYKCVSPTITNVYKRLLHLWCVKEQFNTN